MNGKKNSQKAPKTKILLVDDNEVKLLSIARFIKRNLGIVCQTATSGEEAVESFKKQRQNIVILDILMPKIDGFETASQIKNFCNQEDIKLPHIISYTELADNEVQEKAVGCGFSDYVPRRNKEELLKTIEKWIIFDNTDFCIY
ncbi:MAG: response regulator [Proteobacteria bacterium]|nr:response regulator [Pseudomonadota bacterium]